MESEDSKVFLSEEEVTQLSELDRALLMVKTKLADIEIQKFHMNKQAEKLVEEFHKCRTDFVDKMNYIANLHGLDINGPEKYVLDASEMCFKKL